MVTALVCDTGLRTTSLALKLLRIIARGVCNHSTNFDVSRTFRSRLIGHGQHLSDASRDFATLIFEGHGACRWCGSSCCVCVPSLKFVGLPFGKYWTFTAWALLDLMTLTFNLLTSKYVHWLPVNGLHPVKFGLPRPFRSPVMSRHATDGRTDRRTDRQPRAIYNAPPLRGRGHNVLTWTHLNITL